MVRRLHDNTAARLERKLFADSDDLQKQWQKQVAQNQPTGAQEINLVHQAYEKWVHEYLDPIGKMSIEMLSIGVVSMFITAGMFITAAILVHKNINLIELNNFVAIPIFSTPQAFWFTTFTFSSSTTLLPFPSFGHALASHLLPC